MGFGSKPRGGPAPPPPPPPPPPTSLSSSRTQSQRTNQVSAAQLPPGTIAVGVETEFLLEALYPNKNIRTVEDFSRNIAGGYMQSIKDAPPGSFPGMHNAINEAYHGPKYSQWSIDLDSTIKIPGGTYGLELISPILVAQPGAHWRSHITAVWRHLQQNYRISANESCGTHVHMSVAGGYSLTELKRIACAVLHFEPAFNALLHPSRVCNEYTKSSWIDNPNFSYKKLSRLESMDLVHQCPDIRSLVLLMQPDKDGDHDKMYGWNFQNLLMSSQSTIEFRRGEASTSIHDVFKWVEVTMSFLAASMKGGSRDNLRRVPPTVGGLKWFIQAAQLPENIFNETYRQAFFGKAPENALVHAQPVGKLSSEKAKKLKKKKLEDKNRNLMLAKTLQAPYWI